MTDCVLALDQGTTGSTAVLYRPETWQKVAQANVTFPQHYPEPGWVEHDAEDIWQSILKAIAAVNDQAPKGTRVACIGLTNQRETTLCIDRETGQPLGRAIVWQDRRTAPRCEEIRADERLHTLLKERTGLVSDPYFSATKIEWMMRTSPKIRSAVQSGNALFTTIDAFLIARLSGMVSLFTDATNACRTLLFNLRTHDYDDELLDLFAIPRKALPEVRPSIGLLGKTRGVPGLADGIPLMAALGDQQAALFGQGALNPGEAKVTFGTGAFLLMNTGSKPVFAQESGLLTSVALWAGPPESPQVSYCLEGACFIAGAALQFLRDQFAFFDHSAASEALALSEPGDGNVIFVPSLAGLGAPFWNPNAKGVLFGLTRGTSRAQVTRAVLESIALQNVPLLEAMQKSSQLPLKWLAVDGGAAANDHLIQFQCNVLQTQLRRPTDLEATSQGAARAAWCGFCGTPPEHVAHTETSSDLQTFSPSMGTQEAQDIYKRWMEAASAVNGFYRYNLKKGDHS